MADKLSELKEKLSSMGISTNTPGLRGKERLEELKNRLEDALCSDEHGRGASHIAQSEVKSIKRVVDGLSSAQIRENLILLGQNTKTTGLNGEQRRDELIRRLISAVESASMTETFVEELKMREAERTVIQPRGCEKPENGLITNQTDIEMEGPQRIATHATRTIDVDSEEAHELYRLMDQRNRMIKMRLEPGKHQESGLKELDSTLLQILAEIDFLQSKKTKDKFRKESSVLINDGELMSIAKLLSLLSQKKIEAQEQMEVRKQKVIESENGHPVYGLAVEQELRARIAVNNGSRDISLQAEQSMSSLRDRVLSVKEKYGVAQTDRSIAETKPRSIKSIGEKKQPSAPCVTGGGIDDNARFDHKKLSEPTDPMPNIRRPALPGEINVAASAKARGLSQQEYLENSESKSTSRQQIDDIESSESSEDDGELPPLIGVAIPPPPCDPPSPRNGLGGLGTDVDTIAESSPGQNEDELMELKKYADSKHPCHPISTMSSSVPTDSTFRTDFSPTADIAVTYDKLSGRRSGIDSKQMHHQNAQAAGSEAPTGAQREKSPHDMYGEDSDEEDDEKEEWGEDEHTGSASVAIEEIKRIKDLRVLAKQHERAGRIDDAEETYLEALEVDPTDIRTLDKYAIFLHRRRGELPRAAAFFRRAIQECVPSLLRHSRIDVKQEDTASPTPIPHHSRGAMRADAVTQVLLHYGRFLQRAQGDINLAEDVFRKAVEVSPTDAGALGSLGRFLASDSIDPREPLPDVQSPEMLRMKEAENCFTRALRIEPDNVVHILWYAKLLKSMRKIIQAEVMYSTALKKSAPGSAHSRLEPTAICNYASFLLKYKRDAARAEQLFKDGLARFPKHKGLVRNYKHFSKVAAQKRVRAPPKVPADIAALLAKIDAEQSHLHDLRQYEERMKESLHRVEQTYRRTNELQRGDEVRELSHPSPSLEPAFKQNAGLENDNQGVVNLTKLEVQQEQPKLIESEIVSLRIDRIDRATPLDNQDANGCNCSDEENGPPGLALGYDDGSVVSALTCQFEAEQADRRTHDNSKNTETVKKKMSDILVELDGCISIPGMYCAGITEHLEGANKPIPIDLSDSVISMTVSIKPGTWKWVKDLSTDHKGVYSSTINADDEDEEQYTSVNLRSSVIVSVHRKYKKEPSNVIMLGFVVLTMTAILGSPQIEENVYLVERPFSSDRFTVDPEDNSEKKVKVAGNMKLCLRVGTNEEEDGPPW